MRIRTADSLVAPAVANVIQHLPLAAEDEAAATLARQYAAAIDEADYPEKALDDLGPKLLAVLEALGATPRARAQITKGTQTSAGPSELAKLRATRTG